MPNATGTAADTTGPLKEYAGVLAVVELRWSSRAALLMESGSISGGRSDASLTNKDQPARRVASKASTACSRSCREWAADTCVRMRALP